MKDTEVGKMQCEVFKSFPNKIKFPCKLRKRRIFQICIVCLYFCLWKTWIQFTNVFIPLMIIFRYFMTVLFISGHWDTMLSHSASCFFTLVVVLSAVQDLDHTCTSPWLAILLEPLSDTPCSQTLKHYPHIFYEQFSSFGSWVQVFEWFWI